MQLEKEQLQQGLAALEANESLLALTLLLPLAEAGHAEAQAHVGAIYATSQYRFPKPDDAAGWDSLSGEEIALWEAVDVPEAVKWLAKASEQGIGAATHNLAMLIRYHPGPLSPGEAEAQAKPVFQLAWKQGGRFCAFSDDPQDYI